MAVILETKCNIIAGILHDDISDISLLYYISSPNSDGERKSASSQAGATQADSVFGGLLRNIIYNKNTFPHMICDMRYANFYYIEETRYDK